MMNNLNEPHGLEEQAAEAEHHHWRSYCAAIARGDLVDVGRKLAEAGFADLEEGDPLRLRLPAHLRRSCCFARGDLLVCFDLEQGEEVWRVLTRTTGTPLATLPDGTNRLVYFLERQRGYGMLTPWCEPTPKQVADAGALAGWMIRDERERRAAEQCRFERCCRLLGLGEGERGGPAGHPAAAG